MQCMAAGLRSSLCLQSFNDLRAQAKTSTLKCLHQNPRCCWNHTRTWWLGKTGKLSQMLALLWLAKSQTSEDQKLADLS